MLTRKVSCDIRAHQDTAADNDVPLGLLPSVFVVSGSSQLLLHGVSDNRAIDFLSPFADKAPDRLPG